MPLTQEQILDRYYKMYCRGILSLWECLDGMIYWHNLPKEMAINKMIQ